MKIIKQDTQVQIQKSLNIDTMKPGTVFLFDGEVVFRTDIAYGTWGCVVRLKSGESCVEPVNKLARPLDSDYLIPKEQS